jgi:ABC-type transport system involved in cytochrome c biogenesis ATPase subunit
MAEPSASDYKSIVHLLCTVLLTGVSAWFAFGRDSVTRAELLVLDEKISVIEDRTQEKALLIERINTRVDFIVETLRRIEQKVDNGK